MTKAQLFEERNENLAGIMRKGSATTPLTINKSEERHYDVSTTQHAYTNSIGAPVKLHIKRLTAAEMRERREKGLCFNCDEKFNASHRCQNRMMILLKDEVMT